MKSQQETYRWFKYKLSPERWMQMLLAQFCRCAICGRVRRGRRQRGFHVDHNHVTGKVRGILCGTCNAGLGMFQDSPAMLRRAADYLESGPDYKLLPYIQYRNDE